MTKFTNPQRQVRHEEDCRLDRLFFDNTSLMEFVRLTAELSSEGVDLNGLCSGKYTLGHAALMKGDISVVHALDGAGYDFSLDPTALDYARTAWHGSLYRAVAEAAHRRDPSIIVPSFESEAVREAGEMDRPSFRGVSTSISWPMPEPGDF